MKTLLTKNIHVPLTRAPSSSTKLGESFVGEEKTVGCKMFLPFCRYFSHPANFLPARVPNSDPAGEDRACAANQASLSFPFHAPQCPHPFSLHNYLHPLLPPRPRDSAASPPSTSICVVLPHPPIHIKAATPGPGRAVKRAAAIARLRG